MRQKYIELIVEYIKQRPDYKTNLNDIKINVLIVGATEEEFHEAIRVILEIPRSEIQETTGKKLLKSIKTTSDTIPGLTKFASLETKDKKKYFAAVAVLIIILLFTASGNNF